MKFNPYVPTGIAYPGMFIGRLDEIELIEQSLFQTKNENPQHLLISGERGIGKSSLLFYADLIAQGKIETDSPPFNFLTVSTDLAGVQSQAGIIKQIGRELQSKLRTHQKLRDKAAKVWEFVSSWEILSVKYRGKENEIDPDKALDELIDILVGILDTKEFDGLAIFLDEADLPSVDAGLGEFVKILTERLAKRQCSRVLITLAGQSILLSKLRESHESSLRVFQILEMEPLEVDERNAVVERGISLSNERNTVSTSITDDAIQLIADLSEGYPHFLQQFSYCAFAKDVDDKIDGKDVLDGAHSENGAIAQLGAKYFNEMYWSKIWSEEYRKVLNFLAEHGDSWVLRKDIVQGSKIKESNVNNALAALKKRDIIMADESRRGYYRLPTRSFATWIIAIGKEKIF